MRSFRVSSVLFLTLFFCFLWSPLYLTAKTYTVSNTNDSGVGSFRAAIDSANANTGRDTIEFYIPGTGVKTIFPLSQLTSLFDPSGVFINGLTQSGASMGANPPATLTLKVEINGGLVVTSNGIFVDCDNNRIQGLIINNFAFDGISVEAGPMFNTSNNEIYWNIIGLDSLGAVPMGNGYFPSGLWAGVRIYNVPADAGTSIATNNYIVENLISGNSPYADGVQIMGPQVPGDVFGNFVLRNYIGTDISGMSDLGNAHEGVCLCEGTHHNLVDSNLVSGNDYDGVGLQGYNNEPYPLPPIQTRFNTVSNNIIGLAIDAMTPLPNSCHGVAVGEYGPSKWGCADHNMIGTNNIIAYNGWDGVSVWEDGIDNVNADGNRIRMNSIFDNDSLGIDLQNNGVTLNDIPGDPDFGPNRELNFPVIDSAIYSAGLTYIYGSINIDTDPTQALVEVFKAAPDPTLFGEGKTYLSSATPDASGNWSTTAFLIVGDFVTATTTDQNVNTSEFCLNCVVTSSTGIEEDEISTGSLLKVSSPFLVNSVEIYFEVKKEEKINLSVYDLPGKLIVNLVDKVCAPSSYSVSWNGKNTTGESVPAGIYICILESEKVKIGEKILKIK